jgi:hypothetical protein
MSSWIRKKKPFRHSGPCHYYQVEPRSIHHRYLKDPCKLAKQYLGIPLGRTEQQSVHVNVQFICKRDQTMAASKSTVTHTYPSYIVRRPIVRICPPSPIIWEGTRESTGFSERRLVEMKQGFSSTDVTVIINAINRSFSIFGEQ